MGTDIDAPPAHRRTRRLIVGAGLVLVILAGGAFAIGAFDGLGCREMFGRAVIDYAGGQPGDPFGAPADQAVLSFVRTHFKRADITDEEVVSQLPEMTRGKGGTVTLDIDGRTVRIRLEWGGSGWRVSGYSQQHLPEC